MRRIRLQFWQILLLFLCFTFSSDAFNFAAPSQHIPQQNASLHITSNNNTRFISIHDFADLFKARTYFNEKNKSLVVYLDNKVIKVFAFNPFLFIDDKLYQMARDTYFDENEIYVPLIDFTAIMKTAFQDKIAFNESEGKLEIIPSSHANINYIEISEKANGTLLRISVSRSFAANDVGLRERHGWLYVDVYGGIVDSFALSQKYPSGIISEIIPLQLSDQMAQLSFKLRSPIIEKQMLFDNPNEILISLRTNQDISSTMTQDLEKEKKKWLIDKIVIDPGHGGKDPGAIGPGKTFEKDVTLKIALELKRLIMERSDIKVLMTREDDRFIELKQRTEFANRNEAKLFISIHANSNLNRRVSGVSTYFLGPEKSEEAREAALLENSVIKYETNSKYADLTSENVILSAMAQNIYNTESEDLAAIVQDQISDACNLIDRGVKQAGFYVLWGASMPNILVEVAFISNKQEEKKLRNISFQKKVAEAIYQSIKLFKKKYEWGI